MGNRVKLQQYVFVLLLFYLFSIVFFPLFFYRLESILLWYLPVYRCVRRTHHGAWDNFYVVSANQPSRDVTPLFWLFKKEKVWNRSCFHAWGTRARPYDEWAQSCESDSVAAGRWRPNVPFLVCWTYTGTVCILFVEMLSSKDCPVRLSRRMHNTSVGFGAKVSFRDASQPARKAKALSEINIKSEEGTCIIVIMVEAVLLAHVLLVAYLLGLSSGRNHIRVVSPGNIIVTRGPPFYFPHGGFLLLSLRSLEVQRAVLLMIVLIVLWYYDYCTTVVYLAWLTVLLIIISPPGASLVRFLSLVFLW